MAVGVRDPEFYDTVLYLHLWILPLACVTRRVLRNLPNFVFGKKKKYSEHKKTELSIAKNYHVHTYATKNTINKLRNYYTTNKAAVQQQHQHVR